MATGWVFFLNGCAFATWVSRIPDVRDGLALSPGRLGVVLLALSAGSVIGLPTAGAVVNRLGTARTVLLGSLACLTGLVLAGVAVTVVGSAGVLAAGLFVFGLGMGQWDVAMNLHGATVERGLGRAVMPRFHAAFSLGTVLAALIGSAMSGLTLPVAWHTAGAALPLAVASWWWLGRFLPADVSAPAADSRQPARSAWLEPRTLLIGVVVIVVAFTEGAGNDWMSVAFVDGHHLPPWAGVLAFSVFLAAMTAGRVAGTGLLDRYGRVRVLGVLLVLAGIGTLLVVFGSTGWAFAGAALWGLGVSLGFPVGMSAAADVPHRAPARVSVVSTIGYTAFLAGPPLLGFLGDRVGVLRALGAVSLLLVVALLALPSVRPATD